MSFRVADWPPRSPEIEAAVAEAMGNGDWGSYFSAAHLRLTEELRQRMQVDFVRLCASGTAAVEMTLRAAGVRPGDEVIVSAYDYPGNVRSVEGVGAIPVLVDVAPDMLAPTPEQIIEAAGPRVRAVIVSHLFGHAADVVAIRQVCDDRRWVLIEDACQVPGMVIAQGTAERPAGSVGHLGTMSFGGSKPLTSGNGGAVITSDARLDARLKRLFDRPSDTFPLSSLQATVLLPQLDPLRRLNRQRGATAEFLAGVCPSRMDRWTPMSPVAGVVSPCHYKFAWLAPSAVERARIIAGALAAGLPAGEGFRSLHRMGEKRCRKPMPLKESERLGDRLWVLDHRALMVDPSRHEELAEALRRVHDHSHSPANC